MPVTLDAPGVGATLAEHPQLVLPWAPAPSLRALGPRDGALFGAVHAGTGDTAVELLVTGRPLAALGSGRLRDGSDFGVFVQAMRQDAVGELQLRAGDADAPPLVRLGHLRDAQSRARMRAAARLAQELAASAAFRSGLGTLRDRLPDSDAALDAWLRERIGTAQHASSTVPFGGVPVPAVDSAGVVHGIEGLRVADLAILPDAPTRGPANTAVLIGELVAAAIACTHRAAARARMMTRHQTGDGRKGAPATPPHRRKGAP